MKKLPVFKPWKNGSGHECYLCGPAFLQDYRELEAMCEFLDDKDIKTYVELGIWKGQSINYINRRFELERCIGIDMRHPSEVGKNKLRQFGGSNGMGLEVEPLDENIEFIRLNSHTYEYIAARQDIGDVDFVFIDSNHTVEAVYKDVCAEYALGRARYIGFHDISGHPGPKMLFEKIRPDIKVFESIENKHFGIGILKGPREGGRFWPKT